MKFIKNPPTTESLLQLYESALYNEIAFAFCDKLGVKLDNRHDLHRIRQNITRKYLLLNIPIEEIISELNSNKSEFVTFCTNRHKFYNDYKEDNPDGEFPEGEKLGDEEKSEIMGGGNDGKILFFGYFLRILFVEIGR